MSDPIRDWLTHPIVLADILPPLVMGALLLGAVAAAARAARASRNPATTAANARSAGPLARRIAAMALGPTWETLLRLVLGILGLLFLLALIATFLLVGGLILGRALPEADLPPPASFGMGALLVALLGAPFLIWRNVVAQETLETTRGGLVTDRINAAVASLGAEKEVNRIGRSVSYRLDGRWRTEFEWQDERFVFPEGA
ncbi:MAG: hypothetical protein ACOCY0_04745 [Roseicyclus sp.]